MGGLCVASTLALAAVFAQNALASNTAPVKILFNNQNHTSLPNIEGPWPTVPLQYGPDNRSLDCHLTFWDKSLFITAQSCEAVTTDETTRPICETGSFFHAAAQSENDALQYEVNLTDLRYYTYRYYGNAPESFTLLEALRVSGYGYNSSSDLRIGSEIDVSNTSILVSTNLTMQFSNISTTLPLANSLLSITPSSSDSLLGNLYRAGSIASKSFGLHLGSIVPRVPSSLYLGGYDSDRILGNLITYGETRDLTVTDIRIGVEQGFLPLRNLMLNNGSFPRGPYSYGPERVLYDATSIVSGVGIEPGLPYLYLERRSCDALATALDLEFDESVNLYRWKLPASDPFFQSPTYLEFTITTSYPSILTFYPSIAIKIPFALLQNTFNVSITTANGTILPPARYFPCSPYENDPNNWRVGPALGRAFLQAAFVGIQFPANDYADYESRNWMLAQAPGPRGTTSENVVQMTDDTVVQSKNTTVPPHAWTDSWSDVLPIWTVDADGTPLDQDRAQHGMEASVKTGIGVGSAVSSIILLLIIFCAIKAVRRSWAKSLRVRKEMAAEDQLAREIETQDLERQRTELGQRSPSTSTKQAVVDEIALDVPLKEPAAMENEALLSGMSTSAGDHHHHHSPGLSFRIPRKPVKSRARNPSTLGEEETDILLRDF